ncbi:MAG TPA: glycosyltransferase family 39 protein [Balneolales bacterium]|nr:glycosyltransferase family 39 protein [Balneolales bacterium]
METPNDKPSIWSNSWFPVLLLVLVFIGVFAWIYDPKLNLGGDNVNYYTLGIALSSGHGYVNIQYPARPEASHFPPGYPAIIALVILLTGGGFPAVKILNGFFLLTSCLMLYQIVYLLFKRKVLAFMSALTVMLSMHLLQYSTIMMSEMPYVFFTTLMLWLMTNIALNPEVIWWKSMEFWISLVLIGIGFYIRSIGLTAISGMALFWIVRKQWLAALATFVGFFLMILPWSLRNNRLGGAGGYLHQFLQKNPYNPGLGTLNVFDLIHRILFNFRRYVTHDIPDAIFSRPSSIAPEHVTVTMWLGGLILLALIIWGIFQFKQLKWFVFGFMGSTFLILLLWPEQWYGVRFMIPVLPFVFISLVLGVDSVIGWSIRHWSSRTPMMTYKMVPLLMLLLLPFEWNGISTLNANANSYFPKAYANYFRLALWTQKNLPKSAIVACRKPDFLYIFSRHYTYSSPLSGSPIKVVSLLEKAHVTHIIVGQLGYASTYKTIIPTIKAYPKLFKPVYRFINPDTRLYQFLPDSTQLKDGQ